jgi:septal ring factor EnvC (AmiA/AmiB activator)
MTDDLVKRLRSMEVFIMDGCISPVAYEAADRIEELESKLADAHNELNAADHDGYVRASQQYVHKIEKLEQLNAAAKKVNTDLMQTVLAYKKNADRVEQLEAALRGVIAIADRDCPEFREARAALAGEKKE